MVEQITGGFNQNTIKAPAMFLMWGKMIDQMLVYNKTQKMT